jgi:hypothetical protein
VAAHPPNSTPPDALRPRFSVARIVIVPTTLGVAPLRASGMKFARNWRLPAMWWRGRVRICLHPCSGVSAVGDGEQALCSFDSFQLVHAAVLEAEAGAGDDVLDRL